MEVEVLSFNQSSSERFTRGRSSQSESGLSICGAIVARRGPLIQALTQLVGLATRNSQASSIHVRSSLRTCSSTRQASYPFIYNRIDPLHTPNQPGNFDPKTIVCQNSLIALRVCRSGPPITSWSSIVSTSTLAVWSLPPPAPSSNNTYTLERASRFPGEP